MSRLDDENSFKNRENVIHSFLLYHVKHKNMMDKDFWDIPDVKNRFEKKDFSLKVISSKFSPQIFLKILNLKRCFNQLGSY